MYNVYKLIFHKLYYVLYFKSSSSFSYSLVTSSFSFVTPSLLPVTSSDFFSVFIPSTIIFYNRLVTLLREFHLRDGAGGKEVIYFLVNFSDESFKYIRATELEYELKFSILWLHIQNSN